jgi:hypothetical protein
VAGPPWWVTYIILPLFGSGGVAFSLMVAAGKGWIQLGLKKRLIAFQHELSREVEYARFDFQRRAYDFTLYAAKKHDVYAELYQAMAMAHGAVIGLYGLKTWESFQNFNREDVREFLNGLGLTHGLQEHLLNVWDRDPALGASQIRDYMRAVETTHARKIWQEAWNSRLLKRLYLSDRVDSLCSDLLLALHSYLVEVEYERYPDVDRLRRLNEYRSQADKRLEALKDCMRDEISVGYYRVEDIDKANRIGSPPSG